MIGTAHLEHELAWYFDEAEGAIKQLRSTWIDTIRKTSTEGALVRMGIHYVEAAPLRCGPIYVHSSQHAYRATCELDELALAAAARERRIGAALALAHWTPTPMFTPPPVPPREVLRLRFRELLPHDLETFGIAGFAARKARPLDVQRQVPVRGCGNLAHLTPAALQAWERDRTQLDVRAWVIRLGHRVSLPGASQAEAALREPIRQQCASLELRALTAYAAARQRVPERVRRAGLGHAEA